MASVSKTYAPGGTSATNGSEKAARPARGSRRIGAPHAGHRHAGPRPRLLRGGDRIHLRLRTTLDFDAFSSREPVPTPHQVRGRLSLENAFEENAHDLRLFARRHRLRRLAVLPDLRPAAARAVLTASHIEPALTEGIDHDRHWLD